MIKISIIYKSAKQRKGFSSCLFFPSPPQSQHLSLTWSQVLVPQSRGVNSLAQQNHPGRSCLVCLTWYSPGNIFFFKRTSCDGCTLTHRENSIVPGTEVDTGQVQRHLRRWRGLDITQTTGHVSNNPLCG